MAENEAKSSGFLTNIVLEIVQSPLNIALVCLIGVLVYKIVKSRQDVPISRPPEPTLPKLKKRDFTVEELKKYDGTQEDGRVLVAVNGTVYDVTRGKHFYGPGKDDKSSHHDDVMSFYLRGAVRGFRRPGRLQGTGHVLRVGENRRVRRSERFEYHGNGLGQRMGSTVQR
jgi:hypothetical protein